MKQAKMTGRRVALIEPVGGHGGMDGYDLGLSRGLIAAGWQVTWYTSVETAAPAIPGLGFRPLFKGIWGKASRWKRAALYLLGSLRTLASAVQSGERICHLHFFHGAPEELSLLLLAKAFRRKIVLTVHDVQSFAAAATSGSGHGRRLYRLADRIIVHNQVSRREVIAALRLAPEKISVLPHGNYLDSLPPLASSPVARETLGLAPSAKVVLFFGQIKQVKGLDLLLEAVAEVAPTMPDLVLLVAGRPWKDDFSTYNTLIDRLGIGHLCRLHIRFIPDKEIAVFYAAADVVVLPYHRIYQSGVLLLAMSYGKAVIVSDLPGMTEVVTDEENGFVFKSGSSASLAQALVRALGMAPQRKQVAERGLRYVQTSHDWKEIGRATADLYQTLLS